MMKTPAPLVVGVDGSDSSLTATDWAADAAVRLALPLRIVYASFWERYEGAVPAWSLDRPSGQILAENIVGVCTERVRRRTPGLQVTTDITAEDAASALLREGRTADAVVVGSRGRGELADLLLGSVALVVAARSSGPVVVVRGDRHALEARHGRVLLGIGPYDVDSPAVRFAFREAAARDAELDVVCTWRRSPHEPVDHMVLPGDATRDHEERAKTLLDKAVETAAREHPQVRLRRTALEGNARKVLTERAAAADLLIVGARRPGSLIGMELGRVAHRALHHALCPVAVVPQHHGAPAQAAP
ncbi:MULTISPECIES: universal stress protein [unclassified Streptomyces]|uniref:universal stress protein n=1 Tax=unclassified Streptomyces TaxID=2593676 RepID=UPI00224E6A4F|nr:universal stress protein [Streptomyces sp. NBC_00047]MCX5613268.1 universal stress protein [Streptomyces sp. NBC_00047]